MRSINAAGTPSRVESTRRLDVHHLLPHFTERVFASIQQRELEKAPSTVATTGSLYCPMQSGRTIDGGVRERMKAEDVRLAALPRE